MTPRFGLAMLAAAVGTAVPSLQAQMPREIVAQAVQAELAANKADQSHWRYLQEEKLPIPTLAVVVETAHGALKRKIEENGHPLPPESAAAEEKRVEAFLHDPAQQQKQRKNAEHDDQSAAKLLELLPRAFTWRLVSQTPELTTLAFSPDPAFTPPDMESRVMSAMAGELVVDRAQHRIRTMHGALSQDVNIGYGLLGKLRQGGTFNVERREIAPGLWQITETHVHIDGRALLFKTIGQQEDEVNSRFTPVPPGITLDQAAALLKPPPTSARAQMGSDRARGH